MAGETLGSFDSRKRREIMYRTSIPLESLEIIRDELRYQNMSGFRSRYYYEIRLVDIDGRLAYAIFNVQERMENNIFRFHDAIFTHVFVDNDNYQFLLAKNSAKMAFAHLDSPDDRYAAFSRLETAVDAETDDFKRDFQNQARILIQRRKMKIVRKW